MSSIINAGDEIYEPTETEMIEYGKWMGMVFPEDNAFLWIAREGLKASLPENWKACQSEKGELYYFNVKTGQSVWGHPMDEHFKELFHREKQNPTAQSIAHGAKRKKDKEGQKERLKDAHTDKNLDAVQTETDHIGKDESPVNLQGAELNTLKLKKEFTGEMQIDSIPFVDQGKSTMIFESSNLSANNTHNIPLNELPGRKKNEGFLEVKLAPGNCIDRLKTLGKGNITTVINRTVSSPPKLTSTSPVKLESDHRDKEVPRKNLESLVLEKNAEPYPKEEIFSSKHQQEFEELEKSFEAEKQSRLAALRKKLDALLQNEKTKLEADSASIYERMKNELNVRKLAEIHQIQVAVNEQLEEQKKKAEAEAGHKLVEFQRQLQLECEAKNSLLVNALRKYEAEALNDLKESSIKVLRQYEEAYISFCKVVANSQTDFISRIIEKERAAQCALQLQLKEVKEKNQHTFMTEEVKLKNRLQELKNQHEQEKNELYVAHQIELKKIRENLSAEVENERASVEKITTDITNSFHTAHQLELEALKRDLREMAEKELKEAVEELIREQKQYLKGQSALTVDIASETNKASINEEHVAETDERAKSCNLEKFSTFNENGLRNSSTEVDIYASLSLGQKMSIKTAITEAFKEFFAESPFVLPSSAGNSGHQSPSCPIALSSAVNVDEAKTHDARKFAFPVSFQDHRKLIEAERCRVQESHAWVENQRKNINERRKQLKRTRHQWKQDVLDAKRKGVRSSSSRGELLNKVRLALEEQAKGLEQDELILRDSEAWLLSKEQRLTQFEHQIEEQENQRSHGENSRLNYAIDTTALITDTFKPQLNFAPDCVKRRSSLSLANFSPFESPATTPMFSNALKRIEKRLDEMTSMINLQNPQGKRRLSSSVHGQRHKSPSPVPFFSNNRRHSFPGHLRQTE